MVTLHLVLTLCIFALLWFSLEQVLSERSALSHLTLMLCSLFLSGAFAGSLIEGLR